MVSMTINPIKICIFISINKLRSLFLKKNKKQKNMQLHVTMNSKKDLFIFFPITAYHMFFSDSYLSDISL